MVGGLFLTWIKPMALQKICLTCGFIFTDIPWLNWYFCRKSVGEKSDKITFLICRARGRRAALLAGRACISTIAEKLWDICERKSRVIFGKCGWRKDECNRESSRWSHCTFIFGFCIQWFKAKWTAISVGGDSILFIEVPVEERKPRVTDGLRDLLNCKICFPQQICSIIQPHI